MWYLFIIFAFLAGVALPVQFSINAQLRNLVNSPVYAATISFIIGTVVLLAATLFSVGFTSNKDMIQAPWWIWTGGALGAFYVLGTIILIPRLGAAATVAVILTGQMVASVVIDHFGLLQVAEHPLNLPRIVGALLIIIGVIFIQKY